MNTIPPDEGEAAEADELYRRLSALDTSRPGEPVRRAVLEHASQRVQDSQEPARAEKTAGWRSPVRAWGLPTTFGALAAAVLAVFMLAPRFLPQQQPRDASDQAGAAPAAPPVVADIQESPRTEPSPPPPEPVMKARPVPQVPLPPPLDSPPAELLGADAVQSASQKATARADAPRAEMAASQDAGAARNPAAAPAAAGAVAATAAAAATSAPVADLGAALRSAAEAGDLAELQGLHERRVNIDSRDGAGRTALMLATLHGHSRAVSALLDYGADPNAADARGVTPLDAALAADESEIITELKRHGAH